jgi:hypothetical protein
VEADTLRERGCGEAPRSIREAFLLGEDLRALGDNFSA